MDELVTNKEHREFKVDSAVGDNAKALELMMKKVEWKYLGVAYGIGLSITLVTIFLLIVVVRLALMIF